MRMKGEIEHVRELSGRLGVLSDATKSVSRAYINNFQDKAKQVAIDMFLVRPTACSSHEGADG